MTGAEMAALTAYLQKRFNTENVLLKPRKVQDSMEVYLNGEILGIVYIDDEDPNDVSYDLNISILQEDLN